MFVGLILAIGIGVFVWRAAQLFESKQTTTTPRVPPSDVTHGDPARGAVLFRSVCAPCHGAEGTGGKVTQFPVPPIRRTESPEFLAKTIFEGRRNMPAFGSTLEDADIRDLVSFLAAPSNPSLR